MTKKLLCYLNSKLIDEKLAKISINDRGFLFGDGIFETCHILNYQILDFDLHLQRLQQGLYFLEINIDIAKLKKLSYKLIQKNDFRDGILRIYISRGSGSKGFLPQPKIKPTILIQNKKLPKIPTKIRLGIAEKIKISSQNQLNIHKTANSLTYILAKIEANQQQNFDNIILNENQQICETSSANIFWFKNDILFTPNLKCGLLNGTKRQKLIKFCHDNKIKLQDGYFTIDELKNCEAIFMTNSSFLILTIDELSINQQLIKMNNTKKSRNLLKKLKNGLQEL